MSKPVHVTAEDIAQGWLQTILRVHDRPEKKAFHTVTQISSAAGDGEPEIHRVVDAMLATADLRPLNTVANTIFPEAIAVQATSAEALTARYRAIYSLVRAFDPQNIYGTYFGRLVAYPSAKGHVDQLVGVINNLTRELSNDAPKRARYETTFDIPGQDETDTAWTLPIFEPDHDNRIYGFPCMSMLSFQHDKTHLHAVAHYRSQYLLARGLGNYLGIARLQRYIAAQTHLQVGQLTIVAGHAHVDPAFKKPHLLRLQALQDELADLVVTKAM